MEEFNNASELFHYVFRQLEKRKIEYLVSGSYALNIYTVPRMTRDIDIVVALSLENLNQFLEIFPDGFYYSKEEIINEIKRQRMFNIIHDMLSFKLDFIIKKNSELDDEEFRMKRFEKVLETNAWVLSPEHLFIEKLKWIQRTESDFHLRDLNNLLFYPGLDSSAILVWCRKLNLNTFDLIV